MVNSGMSIAHTKTGWRKKGAELTHHAATNYRAVDISSADDTFTNPTRGIYVGGAGNLHVRGLDGKNCMFTAVAAGYHPLSCIAVVKGAGGTATTATNIVALF